MSQPVHAKIAAELTTLITVAPSTFSKDFTPARTYRPKIELKTNTLTVSVVSHEETFERLTRKSNRHDYKIQVAVQKRLADANDLDEIDEYSFLVEEISDHIDGNWDFSVDSEIVTLTDIDPTPLWIPDHLDKFNQFSNITTCSFRTRRNKS